ncbi:nose resistant to fluoxetine protein 6 [Acyrthosiphon pisum]|uniref:Nose resistant-to-fluoxetine protein N-terminal domain-containing protein n=1 Tax=Acyrthosiphon pisum TaxID=7029 RepID=A0A8R2D6I4_ACYPI|nr:nose resistant to fluoxetine protein 6 [Acyrthosiphon pisum]|eukprot:XP_016662452.1 PREDICTED: nose resistant to fluoxetine protein 6 [Acyrthosiphon pisum]
MWRRNKLYTKGIKMSAVVVVGLLALLLATQSSNCQVHQFPEATECQVDQMPAVMNMDDKIDRIPEVAIANGLPGPWISELFHRALSNFTIRHVGSAACRTQSDMYDRNLRNHTSWAVKMAESWNRYPTGILAGNQYHLGIYDECVDVRYPVMGQYCLSEINLSSSMGRVYSFNRTDNLDDFGNNNAWKTILGWGDYPDKVKRNKLNLGICIPDSCSALDLQTSLQNELDKVFTPEEIEAVVKVDPIMCTVKGDMYPYNTSYYVTRMFFLMLVLICCGTTLYHYTRISYDKNKKKTISEGFGSFCDTFSFIDSSKTLLKFDKDSDLNALYGFKVLMMMAIIMGHRLFCILGNPMSNPKRLESVYLNGPDLLLTASNIIDPFFFISGFLMYLNISRSSIKAEAELKKITSPIIHRVFRMLPAYCAMMAITAHIIPHHGDGPLWSKIMWGESEICKNYWWTNLLFITNFLDSKYGCLVINYYVSCDVQFFVVGVIIVYAYMKNAKFGIGLIATVLVLSVSVPFLVTFMTKRSGIYLMYIEYLESLKFYISVNESYRLSYMRATPFFAGLATSFIVEKLKENKVTFSYITVFGGTFVVSAVCLCAQLYGVKLSPQHTPYYPLEHALFSVVKHCTWSVWGMWCCICLFTTGYGPFTYAINNRLVVVLGRLSYSVFLVNITVILMSVGTIRSPIYFSVSYLMDTWIFDVFKSYVIALALYLVVEAPSNKIIKRWIGQG